MMWKGKVIWFMAHLKTRINSISMSTSDYLYSFQWEEYHLKFSTHESVWGTHVRPIIRFAAASLDLQELLLQVAVNYFEPSKIGLIIRVEM